MQTNKPNNRLITRRLLNFSPRRGNVSCCYLQYNTEIVSIHLCRTSSNWFSAYGQPDWNCTACEVPACRIWHASNSNARLSHSWPASATSSRVQYHPNRHLISWWSIDPCNGSELMQTHSAASVAWLTAVHTGNPFECKWHI